MSGFFRYLCGGWTSPQQKLVEFKQRQDSERSAQTTIQAYEQEELSRRTLEQFKASVQAKLQQAIILYKRAQTKQQKLYQARTIQRLRSREQAICANIAALDTHMDNLELTVVSQQVVETIGTAARATTGHLRNMPSVSKIEDAVEDATDEVEQVQQTMAAINSRTHATLFSADEEEADDDELLAELDAELFGPRVAAVPAATATSATASTASAELERAMPSAPSGPPPAHELASGVGGSPYDSAASILYEESP